jgi:hypothetical protein
MKKTVLKSSYRLQVLNDGSAFYAWVHPWKSRLLLRTKDLSSHSLWEKTKKTIRSPKTTHLQKYTKSFIVKPTTLKK